MVEEKKCIENEKKKRNIEATIKMIDKTLSEMRERQKNGTTSDMAIKIVEDEKKQLEMELSVLESPINDCEQRSEYPETKSNSPKAYVINKEYLPKVDDITLKYEPIFSNMFYFKYEDVPEYFVKEARVVDDKHELIVTYNEAVEFDAFNYFLNLKRLNKEGTATLEKLNREGKVVRADKWNCVVSKVFPAIHSYAKEDVLTTTILFKIKNRL